MAIPTAAQQAFDDREFGRAPNGEVIVSDFDRGMVVALGGVIHEVGPDEIPGYYADVVGVEPAPGLPGVQIIFGNPDDAFVNYLLPQFVITRNDVTPAMARWHPGTVKYRAPKPGEQPIQVTGPGGVVKTGYRRMVQQEGAIPYDIGYTLTIAHERRGIQRDFGQKMLRHAMKRFTPYFTIVVIDSINDPRIYFGTAEAATSNDELLDVSDRMIGWTMSLTVEAELDFLDEREVQTAIRVSSAFSIIP
jgi:hypothetical protein